MTQNTPHLSAFLLSKHQIVIPGAHAMKFYVSVDAEGMPWVPSKYMMMPGDSLYNELREIMTHITNIVVEELFDHGAKEVLVADSHGAMVNIDPFKLDKRASLLRGYPRPMSMIIGAEGSDGALFLGYHTSPQAGGVLAHTYAGRILQRVKVYGSDEATEYLLNAYALGELGVPVVLVAGDAKLGNQVEEFTPWARFVALKEPVSFYADLTKPIIDVEKRLREAVEASIENVKTGKAKPLVPKEPWIELEFKRPFHADIAELFPCVERRDGVTVKLKCEKFIDNFKMLEGLVIAAYSFEK